MVLKKINFAVLASDAALITPVGVGRFKAYKKGNFKDQNVLVEHTLGKRRWYPEETLQLADAEAAAARDVKRIAFAKNLFAYDF